jgi:hypothetical protein
MPKWSHVLTHAALAAGPRSLDDLPLRAARDL